MYLCAKKNMNKDTEKLFKVLPKLADINCYDELQTSLFFIQTNTAAKTDESYSNYSFLNEIVEIDGVEKRIGDIIIKERYSNLQEVENHLSRYGLHLLFVYRYF